MHVSGFVLHFAVESVYNINRQTNVQNFEESEAAACLACPHLGKPRRERVHV